MAESLKTAGETVTNRFAARCQQTVFCTILNVYGDISRCSCVAANKGLIKLNNLVFLEYFTSVLSFVFFLCITYFFTVFQFG